jgi:LAS superfamily LD-carboxypeptidase LdcB
MRRKRRRKNIIKSLFVLVFLFGISYLFYYIDKNDNEYTEKEIINKIEKLGYSEDATTKIINLNIKEEVINNKYSKTLDESLKKDLFNIECISSYINLEEKQINNIKHLCDLNYSDEEIKELTKNLDETTILQVSKYLNELANLSKQTNFVFDNYDRYINYQETDIKKKISFVNVGLDYDFYDNIKDAINKESNLILVNKYYKIDSSFVNELDTLSLDCSVRSGIKMQKNAKEAFEKLCKDAKDQGYIIKGSSGYRSYETQKQIYNSYLRSDTLANVDTYSARAGHSEHQTGYAIDVTNNKLSYDDFGATSEYQWAKINIHKYGFIIRYTKDNQYITGYKDEPWHLRYVGIDVATYIYQNDLTLEEYLLNNKEKL